MVPVNVNDATTMENSMMVPYKTKNSYHMIQQCHSWVYIWRKSEFNRYMHPNVPWCTIYNSQDMEQPNWPLTEEWIWDLRGWERRQWGLVTGILLGLEYIKEPLKRASRWKCSPTLLMKHIWPLQFCCSRNPLSMPQLFRALLKWSLNRLLEWLNFPLWWLLKWNWTLSAHLASPGVSLDTSCLNSVLTTSQLGSL